MITEQMNFKELLKAAKTAAFSASEEILKVYESDEFDVESKSDNSPLTKADKASHKAIVEELEKTGLPILSEEGDDIPYIERKNWEHFWMIDPLDGTKEFIKRNGEFTVNIALIHKQKSVLGVVQVPTTGRLYYSEPDEGAFFEEKGSAQKLKVNQINLNDSGLKIVASRSHLNEETKNFVNSLNDPIVVSMGSSLKLLAIAEGTADLYPRCAPTMEWDTAAAQAIVEAAGGTVKIKDSDQIVRYNKDNLLNPHFLVTCQLSE